MEIEINRFKQLDNIKLHLDNINLLVGGNNAGKSSILQAIQFGVSVAQATILLENASWKKDDRLPTSIGQNELIYLPIKDISFLAQNGKLKEEKEHAISISYKADENESSVLVRKGRNKNIAIEISGQTLGQQLQSIEKPFSMLVTGLAGIQNEETYQTPLVVKKSAARGDSNHVFRNILLLLKSDEVAWQKFKEEIQKIFPSYQIELEFDENRDEFINCGVRKSDKILYPIDTCGTGILQVIQIISYIYLFKPKILLLDEPDSHLHPTNQRLLADRLSIISKEMNLKLVIATHSIYLVEKLIDDANLFWLSHGKLQNTENKRIIEALMEVGALDTEKKLTDPKWIILSEDTDTKLLELLISENGGNLAEGEIKSFKGCSKIETAQILLSYLKEEYPNAKFIIHRDRDFLSEEKINEYKQNFDEFEKISFLIPKYNDIESYFITKEHLAAACNLGSEAVEGIIQQNIFGNSDKKSELIRKYIDVYVQQFPFNEQKNMHGKLATEAIKKFTQYDQLVIHGKEMLKLIRKEFALLKIQDNIISPSVHLKDKDISDLFT